MTRKSGQVPLRATKEGALYIRPADLFKQPNVRALIRKASRSEALRDAHKVGKDD